ncbi:hypothetical protein FRC17_003354 [Serendipita sp. 399]|nr:hypothetical protein FRC17_003354 [Serendipita sp. 399]
MSSQQNPFGREDPTNQKNITSLDDEYALTVTPDIPATYYQGRRFQTGDQPGLQTYWPTEQNAPWTSYAQWNQDDAYDEFLEGNPASYDPQLANQMGRTGIPGANPSYMESVQPRGGTSGSGEPSASGIDWYMGHFEGAQSMQSQTPYPHGIHVPLQQSQDSDIAARSSKRTLPRRKSHGNARDVQQDSPEKEIVLDMSGPSTLKIARMVVSGVGYGLFAATQGVVIGS